MNREQYYSKSEACKKFKLKPEQFEELLIKYSIPVTEKEITTADYSSNQYNIIAKYVYKETFEQALKK